MSPIKQRLMQLIQACTDDALLESILHRIEQNEDQFTGQWGVSEEEYLAMLENGRASYQQGNFHSQAEVKAKFGFPGQ